MTRGDATRRAAGVTRTPHYLSLSPFFSLSTSPSHGSVLSFSPSLAPSPLHALFDRRPVFLTLFLPHLSLSLSCSTTCISGISVHLSTSFPPRSRRVAHHHTICIARVRVCTRAHTPPHTARRGYTQLYSSQDPPRIRTCRPQLLHPRHLPSSPPPLLGASITLC